MDLGQLRVKAFRGLTFTTPASWTRLVAAGLVRGPRRLRLLRLR